MMIGILIDMIRIYWLSFNFQSEIFLNAIYLHTWFILGAQNYILF